MIIYDINSYLESDSTLLSLSGKASITINPFIGYEDEEAPIFLYQYSQDIKSEDMYYLNHDTVWYTVLDTDVARAFSLRDRIIALLNHSDHIQEKNIDDNYGRLLYMNLYRSTERRPNTVEGYYQLSSLFEFCWVPLD